MDDPRETTARIRLAASAWDRQPTRRRTDEAIGNLLRAVAQFPAHREPTAHERMIIDAALELADAVLDQPGSSADAAPDLRLEGVAAILGER